MTDKNASLHPGLPRALETLATVWSSVPRWVRWSPREEDLIELFAAVFAASIEGDVKALEPPWRAVTIDLHQAPRVDLLIGDRGDLPTQRAVVEVRAIQGKTLDTSRAIELASAYRDAFDATHAGLIEVSGIAWRSPSIASINAPNGRPVWVLRLPA